MNHYDDECPTTLGYRGVVGHFLGEKSDLWNILKYIKIHWNIVKYILKL